MNPKTSDKSKRSPRFRIHHLCMLHFNSCLFRSRKSKKKIRFAFRKNLKLKISEFRPTRPHKKTTYRHQRHLHRVCYKLRISSIGRVCKRSRRLWRGKFTRKLILIWKKIVREFTFFFLKTLRQTPPNWIIMYLTDDPFRDSLFIDSNRLGLITVVKNEQNSQIYEF